MAEAPRRPTPPAAPSVPKAAPRVDPDISKPFEPQTPRTVDEIKVVLEQMKVSNLSFEIGGALDRLDANVKPIVEARGKVLDPVAIHNYSMAQIQAKDPADVEKKKAGEAALEVARNKLILDIGQFETLVSGMVDPAYRVILGELSGVVQKYFDTAYDDAPVQNRPVVANGISKASVNSLGIERTLALFRDTIIEDLGRCSDAAYDTAIPDDQKPQLTVDLTARWTEAKAQIICALPGAVKEIREQCAGLLQPLEVRHVKLANERGALEWKEALDNHLTGVMNRRLDYILCRAAHDTFNGISPRPSECAALARIEDALLADVYTLLLARTDGTDLHPSSPIAFDPQSAPSLQAVNSPVFTAAVGSSMKAQHDLETTFPDSGERNPNPLVQDLAQRRAKIAGSEVIRSYRDLLLRGISDVVLARLVTITPQQRVQLRAILGELKNTSEKERFAGLTAETEVDVLVAAIQAVVDGVGQSGLARERIADGRHIALAAQLEELLRRIPNPDTATPVQAAPDADEIANGIVGNDWFTDSLASKVAAMLTDPGVVCDEEDKIIGSYPPPMEELVRGILGEVLDKRDAEKDEDDRRLARQKRRKRLLWGLIPSGVSALYLVSKLVGIGGSLADDYTRVVSAVSSETSSSTARSAAPIEPGTSGSVWRVIPNDEFRSGAWKRGHTDAIAICCKNGAVEGEMDYRLPAGASFSWAPGSEMGEQVSGYKALPPGNNAFDDVCRSVGPHTCFETDLVK